MAPFTEKLNRALLASEPDPNHNKHLPDDLFDAFG